MPNADPLPTPSPETSDLEERLLANQKILQALLVYMARLEPRFLDHLRERFVEPMNTSRRKQHYRDADGYAEEFIGALMHLGEARAPWPWEPEMSVERQRPPKHKGLQALSTEPHAVPDRVQVRERNGIWAVKVDDVFRGDYRQKEHAFAAAALLKLSL